MTTRSIIVGGVVLVIAFLAIGLFLLLRRRGAERALRRRIINNRA